uniref:Uncharacterized protein n=1 Tax=Romanomermis culicivorax TaxID=13658 RepID=A0A915I0A3_ROMCU
CCLFQQKSHINFACLSLQEFAINHVPIFRIVAAEMQLMTDLVETLLTIWPLDLEKKFDVLRCRKK